MAELSSKNLTGLLDTDRSMSSNIFDIVHWVRSTYGPVGLTTLIIYSATAIEIMERDASPEKEAQ